MAQTPWYVVEVITGLGEKELSVERREVQCDRIDINGQVAAFFRNPIIDNGSGPRLILALPFSRIYSLALAEEGVLHEVDGKLERG